MYQKPAANQSDTKPSARLLPRKPIATGVSIATLILSLSLSANLHAAEDVVEEIIVLGQDGIGNLRLNAENNAGSRLGLTAMDMPGSVGLISSEEIATKGDYDALQAVTRSTGISSSASPGNGGTSISSRGFNGHGSTVYTYDGTRLYIVAGTVTYPADTWTLDRVEILRGAGSVINGVGAIGTTINYVPKTARLGDPDFAAVLASGSFAMNRIALGGGAQISEQWAFRLDGSHQQEDGYADNSEEKREVLAGSLLYQPSEDLSVRFSADIADVDSAPFWGTPLVNGRASATHRRNNYNFTDGKVEYKDQWYRAHVEWDLAPNVSFRSDTFFLDVKRDWQNLEEYAFNNSTGLVDRAFYLGIVHDEEQLGTRFDFLVDSELGGKRNKLSVGAEINAIELNYLNNFSTGGFDVADSVAQYGFNPGSRPQQANPTILDYQTDTRQYALFIDNVTELTDHLSLVLGGRFDEIDFERFDLAIGDSPAAKFSSDFSEFTWRAGLVYQPMENLSLYAQASTAADPVSSPVSLSAGDADFDLSTGRQYEIGLKQQILQGRGEYTLAYFDIEKEDLLTRLPASAITEQIGQQSSKGFEFTFSLNPTDNFSIDFNAATIDAEFDEFYSSGVSLAGNTPRNVPDNTANLWLNWSPINKLTIGGGVRYVDSRFADDSNSETMPDYTVFDASISWAASPSINVILRARNLTDEEDYVLAPYVANQWIFGDPRAFEMSVSFDL